MEQTSQLLFWISPCCGSVWCNNTIPLPGHTGQQTAGTPQTGLEII